MIRQQLSFAEWSKLKEAGKNPDKMPILRSRPVCLSLDGLPLMDDVGGIHGYVGFLRTIHGNDSEEKKDMREWAKWMGWTGRMNKTETLF